MRKLFIHGGGEPVRKANPKLEEQTSFRIGKSLDGLGIVSYLTMNELAEDKPVFGDTRIQRTVTYSLKNGGKVSLIYDPSTDRMGVEISKGVDVKVARDLESLGRESRTNYQRDKLKVLGVFS